MASNQISESRQEALNAAIAEWVASCPGSFSAFEMVEALNKAFAAFTAFSGLDGIPQAIWEESMKEQCGYWLGAVGVDHKYYWLLLLRGGKMRIDIKVRDWLLSSPGQFKSDISRDDVLRQALAASGIQAELASFEGALKRAGYQLIPRGTSAHPCWLLNLPSYTASPRHLGSRLPITLRDGLNGQR